MSYRDDLDALAARHAALAREVAEAERARDEAARELDEARAGRKLPVLDTIRVASPCKADWNAMTGDDRVRQCGTCNKQVFDLSSMTRDEAEALLLARAHLCIRYYRRADGTILLADCPAGAPKRRRRRRFAALAVVAAGGGMLAHRVHQLAERPATPMVSTYTAEMGEVSRLDTWEQGGAPDPEEPR